MLKEVTSLFDYFNKCAGDKHYHRAAIAAYRYNYREIVNFRKAKRWIDEWVEETVISKTNGTGYQDNCDSMVRFLNKFIREINKASEARKARRLHTGEGATPPTAVGEAPPR